MWETGELIANKNRAELQNRDATLIQLRAWLARREDGAGETRLPPERVLSAELGVSRGELRKALATLEHEGVIWRHVGKGTFIGARPLEELPTLTELERRTNPAEVMRARLILEPALARDAALHATKEDMAALEATLMRMQTAETWRHYEAADNAFHRGLAEAGNNTLALALFDVLNTVRRAIVWSRERKATVRPPADHHSFAEHAEIVQAIRNRDLDGAASAMRHHLNSVEEKLLGKTGPMEGPD